MNDNIIVFFQLELAFIIIISKCFGGLLNYGFLWAFHGFKKNRVPFSLFARSIAAEFVSVNSLSNVGWVVERRKIWNSF